MAPLKPLLIIVLSLLFSSCSKLQYLVEQGTGQLSLLTKARENEIVKKDVKIPRKFREKIERIEVLKKYFYKHWNRKESNIYNKTVMLKDNTVTYLVISSPHNDIVAKEDCFPIMGCFPYLGFFKKTSAFQHVKELEEEGYVTYVRPVYAYSTLGYFSDPILSSFFYYSDKELSELIFHELFHTIFFIKDEVELNENMANFFSKKMTVDYLNISKKDLKQEEKRNSDNQKINKEIVIQTQNLQKLYSKDMSKEKSKLILNEFMSKEFIPSMTRICRELGIGIKGCHVIKKPWNNARFAAFLTYENKINKINNLFQKKSLSLKEFFGYMENEYNRFEDDDTGFKKFSNYLFREIK